MQVRWRSMYSTQNTAKLIMCRLYKCQLHNSILRWTCRAHTDSRSDETLFFRLITTVSWVITFSSPHLFHWRKGKSWQCLIGDQKVWKPLAAYRHTEHSLASLYTICHSPETGPLYFLSFSCLILRAATNTASPSFLPTNAPSPPSIAC